MITSHTFSYLPLMSVMWEMWPILPYHLCNPVLRILYWACFSAYNAVLQYSPGGPCDVQITLDWLALCLVLESSKCTLCAS